MATKPCVVSLGIILVLTLNLSYAFGVVDKLTINLIDKWSSTKTTFTQSFELFDEQQRFTLNVPKSSFFVIQVHTYMDELILSNNTEFTIHTRAKGANVGLVQIVDQQNSYDFYLQHNFLKNTTVLVAVTIYDEDAPIPGGCNMTFDVEKAPYQKLVYNKDMIMVDVQPPSIGDHFCEADEVELEMYRYFLGSNFDEVAYFNILRNLLDVDFVMKNAKKVPTPQYFTNLRRYYVNYQGVGSIYLAVATYKNKSSSYVPTISYGCDFTEGLTSCFRNGPDFYILPFAYIIGGILINQNMINFLLLGLTYALILIPLSLTWQILINALISFIISMIVFTFSINNHVNYLISSYILTCNIFFSFIGDIYIFQNVHWYWVVFCLLNMVLALFMHRLPDSDYINGSFLAVFYIYTGIYSYFSFPSVNLFVVNLKHLTVPNFSYAVVQNPDLDFAAFTVLLFVVIINYFRRCCTRSVTLINVHVQSSEETPLLA